MIMQFFTDMISYAFSWLFNITDSFVLTLCITLFVFYIITLPACIKNAEKNVKMVQFNARWKEVKAETQKKYHGNTTIVNRMYYEFKRLNKPKPVYCYIFIPILEIFFICGLYSAICRPFTGIVGIDAEKVNLLLSSYKCASEMDLINLFAGANGSLTEAVKEFYEVLSANELVRLESYIHQMQFCGMNLFVRPDLHELSPSLIFPFINVCLIAYSYAKTVYFAKGVKGLPIILISTLTSITALYITTLVPVAISLYFVIKRAIDVIGRLVIKKIVKKKNISVSFSDVDLYQFEDIREELVKEDAKERRAEML